jgi:hypothetical protein
MENRRVQGPWKHRRCPVCGRYYARFRDYPPITFRDAYWQLRREHDERIEKSNDYSKPARLRAVLGRLHEHKRSFWELHVAECEAALERALEGTEPRSPVPPLFVRPAGLRRALRKTAQQTEVRFWMFRQDEVLLFSQWPHLFNGHETVDQPRSVVPAEDVGSLVVGVLQARTAAGCAPLFRVQVDGLACEITGGVHPALVAAISIKKET